MHTVQCHIVFSTHTGTRDLECGCHQTYSTGIQCLNECLCIVDMDVDLASVVTAVSKNKSIKHLNMGRNMNNMKAKNIASVMDAVVQMIQVSCVILYLFMW